MFAAWGHNSCPKTEAQLVYAGRAGGSHYSHSGGGGNPQCLPLDPTFYKTIGENQPWGFLFGAEYEQINSLVSIHVILMTQMFHVLYAIFPLEMLFI